MFSGVQIWRRPHRGPKSCDRSLGEGLSEFSRNQTEKASPLCTSALPLLASAWALAAFRGQGSV